MIDKANLVLHLERAAGRFIKVCDASAGPHWIFRAHASGWCAGEVAEHLTLANQGILALLSKLLSDSPIAGRQIDILDDEIPYLFYRGDEPPNVSTPSGTWANWRDHAGTFEESVNNLKHWAAEARIDLREYGVMHPVFGLMDGVQWLLFAGAHIERHRAQIIGLIKEAGLFHPKNTG